MQSDPISVDTAIKKFYHEIGNHASIAEGKRCSRPAMGVIIDAVRVDQKRLDDERWTVAMEEVAKSFFRAAQKDSGGWTELCMTVCRQQLTDAIQVANGLANPQSNPEQES